MRIEDKVNGIVDCCINDSCDLNIEHLAYMFDVHIMYNHKRSFYVKKSGIDVIGLKFNHTYKMFADFCHEAGHMFMHTTDQHNMAKSFNVMQEAEADKFALLLMLPEKLIIRNKLYETTDIMTYFNVSEDVAIKRLEMLMNRAEVSQLKF